MRYKMIMRYKTPSFQKVYDAMLACAADPSSELYLPDGTQRTGALQRCAFWDGFNGVTRSPHVVPGTFSAVCYQAGKAWRARQRKEAQP